MKIFFILIELILFGMWYFVWKVLVEPTGLAAEQKSILGALLLVMFGFQTLRMIRMRAEKQPLWLLYGAYLSLGLMSHLFLGAVVLSLIVVIFSPDFSWVNWGAGLSFLLAFAANAFGVWSALRGPQVVTVKVNAAGHDFENLKIVQISDLHIGPIVGEAYVQDVIDKVNALGPDIIAVTGDLVDGDVRVFDDLVLRLGLLRAKQGVYYCPGNHEYYWNFEAWMPVIKKAGMEVLLNQGKRIQHGQGNLWIAGVHDYSAERINLKWRSSPEEAVRGAVATDYKILLAHQPKSCFTAEKAGFDLMLSGHTHRGQFFPFTHLVRFFNPYVKGLNQHGIMKVYVNAGTGFWGPPIRLGAPSEITELILQGK